MADTTVIGLTLVKINGRFRLDVKNARWSTRRAVTQVVTGAGVRAATGEELPSGSFDEVIPRDAQFDWRSLRNFSIEVYDKETRGVLLFAAEGCNWSGLDGNTDLGSANTGKAITWSGTKVTKV